MIKVVLEFLFVLPGPIYRKALVEAAKGDMGVKSKVAVQETLVDLELPESVTVGIQLDVYKETLKAKTEVVLHTTHLPCIGSRCVFLLPDHKDSG